MYFRDIPGQDIFKERLIRSVKKGRISHAQLMHGPEGCGKLAMAVAYARYLSCTNPSDEDSCGKCLSCIKYTKLVHPDLHFSFPASAKDDETGADKLLGIWREAFIENPYMNQYDWYERIGLTKKQGIIGTQQSKDIIRKLSMKEVESSHKILIMWLPERMNPTCANRLLKMIEEPSGRALFLLVSENPDLVLPTVRSRTQLLRLPKIKDTEIIEALKKISNASDEAIETAARISHGNYNLALASLQEDGTHDSFDQFVSLMRLAYGKDIIELLNWVDKMAASGREKQKLFLLNSLRLIRENFMVHLNKPELTHMSKYEDEFSVKFSRFVNSSNVAHIYTELNEAYNHISANGYPNIIFTDMSLKMIRYLHM